MGCVRKEMPANVHNEGRALLLRASLSIVGFDASSNPVPIAHTDVSRHGTRIALRAPRVAERSANGTAGRQSCTYLARFVTNSSVSPAAVLALVNFSSSAVSEVIMRF